jgi:hypothetical protein
MQEKTNFSKYLYIKKGQVFLAFQHYSAAIPDSLFLLRSMDCRTR